MKSNSPFPFTTDYPAGGQNVIRCHCNCWLDSKTDEISSEFCLIHNEDLGLPQFPVSKERLERILSFLNLKRHSCRVSLVRVLFNVLVAPSTEEDLQALIGNTALVMYLLFLAREFVFFTMLNM